MTEGKIFPGELSLKKVSGDVLKIAVATAGLWGALTWLTEGNAVNSVDLDIADRPAAHGGFDPEILKPRPASISTLAPDVEEVKVIEKVEVFDELPPTNPPVFVKEADNEGAMRDLLKGDPYLEEKTRAGFHWVIKNMLRHMGITVDLPWNESIEEWEKTLKDLAVEHKIDVMQPWNGSETYPIILNIPIRTNVDDSTTFLWQVHPETLSPENWPVIAVSQELLASGKYRLTYGEVNVPAGYDVKWRYSDIDDIGSDAYSIYGYMVDADGNAVAWFNTDKAYLDPESGEIVNVWYWVDEDGAPQQEGQVVMREGKLVVIDENGEVIMEIEPEK